MKQEVDNYGSINREEESLRIDDGSSFSPAPASSSTSSSFLRFPAFAAAAMALFLTVGSIYSNFGGGALLAHLVDHDLVTGAPHLSKKDLLKQLTPEAAAAVGTKADPNAKTRHYSNTQRFFLQQVDHFDENNTATWPHRYYAKRKYWKGPGHPIFLMIGGEGGNNIGFFYNFVAEVLAKQFGAYSLHPEHRWYGPYKPMKGDFTADDLVQLLTPEQAMMDMLQIAQHYRQKLGCSMEKGHKHYCPVMVVGGSYPGFLAAMMRLLYPEYIDLAYASSAPLKLYSHEVDQWGYYDTLTKVADHVSPGCAAATTQALQEASDLIRASTDFETLATERLGFCPGSIPDYIDNSVLLTKELMQVIETSFADANMIGNYPPGNTTWLARLCHVFQYTPGDALDKVAAFWGELEIQDDTTTCFNMQYQLSTGFNATLSGSDWTGDGPGWDGTMWDFQCCFSLMPDVGFSHESMFPYRKWNYEWLTEHCVNRFGVVGDMYGLVKKWKFDDLVNQGASRIVFTNGENDIWRHGGITESLSDSLPVINFPNGAHHSEVYAFPNDTPDIKEGQKQISDIVGKWLKEIRKEES